MQPVTNAVGWFEIPVLDMERAIKFYGTLLDLELERHQMGPLDMAWFPSLPDGKGAAGSLVKHEWYRPAADGGPLLYFTAPSGDLKNEGFKTRTAAHSGRCFCLNNDSISTLRSS